MRKFIWFSLIYIIFLGCNRFEKKLGPVKISDFESEFQTAFIRLCEEGDNITWGLTRLMSLYAGDYVNDGEEWEDRFDFYNSQPWTKNSQLILKRLNNTSPYHYYVQLNDVDLGVNEFWEDTVSYREGHYIWTGNHVPMSPEAFQNKFVLRATKYLAEGNINRFLDYYDDQYLNNHQMKAHLRKILTRDWSEEVRISLIFLAEENDLAKFHVELKDPSWSLEMEWEDYLYLQAGKYLWIGDQKVNIISHGQNMLVQSTTDRLCTFCVQVSEELHRLEALEPERFIFLKYHIGDNNAGVDLSNYNNYADEKLYFDWPDANPLTLFQAQDRVAGGSPTEISRFVAITEQHLNAPLEVELGVTYDYATDNRTLTGIVSVKFIDIETENLYLQYAIYEKEAEEISFVSQKKVTHVVRARGSQKLELLESEKPVPFTLVSPNLLRDNEHYLVVWVQKMMNGVTRTDEDRVLNVIKVSLW